MMAAFPSFLDSRVSFELATLFVTWVAIALLGLIAVSLHIRLQRLERADAQRREPAAFHNFSGKTVYEVLGAAAPEPPPRVVLFLTSSCPSCRALLAELRSPKWRHSSAIVWMDAVSDGPAELPPHVTLVPGGPKIGAALGIRVMPFALVADQRGTIVQASPVNTLEPLRDVLERPPVASSVAFSMKDGKGVLYDN